MCHVAHDLDNSTPLTVDDMEKTRLTFGEAIALYGFADAVRMLSASHRRAKR